MNYHIIRTNETLDGIAKMYNLTIQEIKDYNRHITVWDKLIPGTRLKLPAIPDSIIEEINDIEPFIEDYYPKLDTSKYESNDVQNQNDEEINYIYNKEEQQNINEDKETLEPMKNSSFTNSIKLPKNYSYYYNPYDYYKYLQRKRLNRK